MDGETSSMDGIIICECHPWMTSINKDDKSQTWTEPKNITCKSNRKVPYLCYVIGLKIFAMLQNRPNAIGLFYATQLKL